MSKTEEYISKALAGEKEAYANLYKLSFRGSYYIAIRLLGNEQDAFSAVQYAFSKAFSSLPRLKVPASFDVWVKQLTAKYCCDVLRSKDADIFSDSAELDVGDGVEDGIEFLSDELLNSADAVCAIEKFIGSFSVSQKTVIYLQYFARIRTERIAEFLSVDQNDVDSLLCDARERIQIFAERLTHRAFQCRPSQSAPVLSGILEIAKNQQRINPDMYTRSFAIIQGKPDTPKQQTPAPVKKPNPTPMQNFAFDDPFAGFSQGQTVQTPVEQTEAPKEKKPSDSRRKAAIIVIIAAVILIALVIIFAVTRSSEKKPEETTTEFITTTQLTTLPTSSVKTENLRAEPSDYDMLLSFIGDVLCMTENYDVTSSDAKEVTYDILMQGVMTKNIYTKFFDENSYEKRTGKDPEGRLDSKYFEYWIFPAENIDWIMLNVFNIAPDRSIRSDVFYYLNGYYYIGIEGRGYDDRDLKVIDVIENNDGTYTIRIRCDITILGDEEPSETKYFFVTVALRAFEGRKYWSFYKMKLTDEKEELTTEAPVKNLTANKSDFNMLLEFMEDYMRVGSNYDSSSPSATKDAYEMLTESSYSTAIYKHFFDEDTIRYVYDKKDPLKKFDYNSHYIYPGENIDWIVSNVFCTEIDHSITKENWFYYYNGNFYVSVGDRGDYLRILDIIETKTNSDGSYTVKINHKAMVDEESPVAHENIITLKTALREKDGKRFWAFYSIDNKDIPISETTTVRKTDDYMAVYNKYLKDLKRNQDTEYMSFGLAYINDDDIPELLVSQDIIHASGVVVVSCVDGKAVETDEYGSNGDLIYGERSSIIVSEQIGSGSVYGVVYRLSENGTAKEILRYGDNHYDAEWSDEIELICRINDQKVSEKEYEEQKNKVIPKNLTVFDDGYDITDANIDKYCS